MLDHEPQAWIVYWLDGQELCRISAAEATCDEPRETLALLAHENGRAEDDITVQLEGV